MKLLHTADWHLGAKLGRHDRTPDHRTALKALLEIADSERPDLIIHAGDLFDAYRPPYPALRLAVTALQRLAHIAPTVVISGNHDSGALFDVLDDMARMASPRRLRFVTRPRVLATEPPGGHGDTVAGVAALPRLAEVPVALACVPFIPPGAITDYATGDASRFEGDYADGIRNLNDHVIGRAREAAGPNGIVLYAAHLHVDGARPGNSERRFTVGEDHATHTKGLHRALYCAFGHIHDPQQLPGSARGRYAGSLIPLDYGERRQSKHAVVVTIGDDVRLAERELPPGRPLENFTGTFQELEARAANGALDGCFLKALVKSDDPIPDLADRVAEWSPECVIFNLVNEVANRPAKAISGTENGEEPSIEDLFVEWRSTAATGQGDEGAPGRGSGTLSRGGGRIGGRGGAGLRVGRAHGARRSGPRCTARGNGGRRSRAPRPAAHG